MPAFNFITYLFTSIWWYNKQETVSQHARHTCEVKAWHFGMTQHSSRH